MSSEKPVPTANDRWLLTEKLEEIAAPLSGKRGHSFVDDKSLCTSCRHAHVFRRGAANNRTIRCSKIGEVPSDITECSDYLSMNQLSLGQMTEIAMILDPRDFIKNGYL